MIGVALVERIVKYLLISLLVPIELAAFVLLSFKYENYRNCNSLKRLASADEYIGKLRAGAFSIEKVKELKFNLFMGRQLDQEEFEILGSAFGIDPNEVSFRFNAPRGVSDKTAEKINSISVLINRCCILKVPMKNENPLTLSEVESKLRVDLKNKNLYLSCEFYLIN